jgi:hypothetical protein
LHIHNVYNPEQATEDRQSVLPLIVTLLETYPLDDQMVLGDFNSIIVRRVASEWFGKTRKRKSSELSWIALA